MAGADVKWITLPGFAASISAFDRMLIAQAALADLVLLSNEAVIDRYGIRRLR
jgi:PIN domain nuclease of toxin-antitoxin system